MAIQVVVDDAPRKHIRYVVFVREQVDDYDLLILILLVCLEAAGEAYSIQVLVREGPTAHRIERVVSSLWPSVRLSVTSCACDYSCSERESTTA